MCPPGPSPKPKVLRSPPTLQVEQDKVLNPELRTLTLFPGKLVSHLPLSQEIETSSENEEILSLCWLFFSIHPCSHS